MYNRYIIINYNYIIYNIYHARTFIVTEIEGLMEWPTLRNNNDKNKTKSSPSS